MQAIKIGTLVSADNIKEKISHLAGYGFETFSITFGDNAGAYDLSALARDTREALDGTGSAISSVSVYGNPLLDTESGLRTRESWIELIDAAERFGTDLVAGFTGRLTGVPVDESMPKFKEVFTYIVKYAQDKGVRIAFENCFMGGNWERGDWNIAVNPDAWELMFAALPAENIGLEWEPCHQILQLIDPARQLRQWAPKVFHLHGKDANIHRDILATRGIHAPGGGRADNKAFSDHRFPGFGDSDWRELITILHQHQYAGTIDIEGWHDPVYRGDLEMTGQVASLQYLKRCRAGDFVPNPTA